MNIFSSSGHHGTYTDSRRTAARSSHVASDGQPRTEEPIESGFMSALFAALFALPVTVLIGFALLLIVTAVAYTNADPDALTTPLSLAALGLTALMGGMVSGMRGYRQPLLSALLLGLLLVLLQLGGSLFFSDALREQLTLGGSALWRWGLRVAVLPLSLLGGCIGKNKHRDERSRGRTRGRHTHHGH